LEKKNVDPLVRTGPVTYFSASSLKRDFVRLSESFRIGDSGSAMDWVITFQSKSQGESILRLSVIGCGYVGLVTGVCLAEAGHEVVCTDIDSERIAKLNAGGVPIYEEHLERILASARKAGRVSY